MELLNYSHHGNLMFISHATLEAGAYYKCVENHFDVLKELYNYNRSHIQYFIQHVSYGQRKVLFYDRFHHQGFHP